MTTSPKATGSNDIDVATTIASVVIPTWRRAAWLEGCLLSLARQRTAPIHALAEDGAQFMLRSRK